MWLQWSDGKDNKWARRGLGAINSKLSLAWRGRERWEAQGEEGLGERERQWVCLPGSDGYNLALCLAPLVYLSLPRPWSNARSCLQELTSSLCVTRFSTNGSARRLVTSHPEAGSHFIFVNSLSYCVSVSRSFFLSLLSSRVAMSLMKARSGGR